MEDQIKYLTADSLELLKKEKQNLIDVKIPDIARRIDEAKQQGDLSENAEYTQAREDMSWAQTRVLELDQIINNSQIIVHKKSDQVQVGSSITVKINDKTKDYTIVGPHEINPALGLISNESPLGEAFIGHKAGDTVEVRTPAGKIAYKIIAVK